MENDEESVSFVSLFDEKTFPNAQSMLAHCQDNHNFDIWKIRQNLGEYPFIIKYRNLLIAAR